MNYFDEVKKLEDLLIAQYETSELGKACGAQHTSAFVRGAMSTILACCLMRMARINKDEAERFITEQIRAHSGK